MIDAMAVRIDLADVSDLHQVLADHARYWGERDLRALHLTALVQEFGATWSPERRTASAATSSDSSPPTTPATST